MLFKQATVIRIAGEIPTDVEEINKALEQHKFTPCRDMESERLGWVAPTEGEEDPFVRAHGAIYLICLKIQKKLLPPKVIQEELKSRLAARGMSGKKVRAKERQQMLEEIRFDLLPHAFSTYSNVLGYIDMQRREIIVGSANGTQVDDFLSCLRMAFGSLPVVHIKTKNHPQHSMTPWARDRQAPPKVKFGQEITLIDTVDGGRGTFRNQDLSSDEILQCIASGKQVQRVSLEWNDYLGFSVDDTLVLRKITALNMFNEEFEGDDDDNAKLDSDLFMTYTGLRQLLPELYRWFDVVEPGSEDDLGSPSGVVASDHDPDDYNPLTDTNPYEEFGGWQDDGLELGEEAPVTENEEEESAES